MLHSSLYDEIDTEWTQWAYRNRVMMAGIGTTFDQMVEITGDQCLDDPNPHLADRSNEMALVFTYNVTLEDPAKREVIAYHQLELCDEKFGIEGEEFSILHGVVHIPVTSKSFIEAIGFMFVTDSIYHGIVGQKPDAVLTPTAAVTLTITPTVTATGTSK